MALDVGVLDFASFSPQHVLDHAEIAEDCGYGRVWLAEHLDGGAGHANALMMSLLVAGVTRRVRVGPAGVLARLRHPLHVANDAALAAALFPGRIDLGVAGGKVSAERMPLFGPPAADPRADFEARCRQILTYLRGEGEVTTTPRPRHPPDYWQLCVSDAGLRFAAELGVHTSISLLHAPQPVTPDRLSAHRDDLTRLHPGRTARVNLALAVACAADETEARALPARRAEVAVTCSAFGTAPQCAEQILEIAERYAVDEVIVLPLAVDSATHGDTLHALADALGLKKPGRPANPG